MDPNFEPPVSSAVPAPASAPRRRMPIIVRVVRVLLLLSGISSVHSLRQSPDPATSLDLISTGTVLLAGAMLFVIPARRSTHLFVSGVLVLNAAAAALILWEYWPDLIHLGTNAILFLTALVIIPIVLLIFYTGGKSSRQFAGYGQNRPDGFSE